MKNPLLALSFLTLLAASASVHAGKKEDGTVVTEKDYDLPTCPAPVASIMIGSISCKAQACQAPEGGNDPANAMQRMIAFAQAHEEGVSTESFVGIGDGFGAMLTTTLQQTGCFDIQDRETIAQLKEEMEMAGLEFKPQVADFLVTGAVTSISAQTRKRQIGGGMIPVVGAFSKTSKNAEIALDIRIVNTHSGRIQASSTFVGNNQTTSTGLAGAAFAGALVGGSMSNIKNTPMEAVVRDVLARVAVYTSNQIIATKNVQVAQSAAPAELTEPTETGAAVENETPVTPSETDAAALESETPATPSEADAPATPKEG